MTLLNRPTLVDRPELIERGDDGDNQDSDEPKGEVREVQTLGQGGGPVINGLEFERGDYEIVAGANASAVLATGTNEGRAFRESFINAAAQLKELEENGQSIRSISRFSVENGISDLGISEEEFEALQGESTQARDSPDVDRTNSDESEHQNRGKESITQEEDSTLEVGEDDMEVEESVEDEDGENDLERIEQDIEEVTTESQVDEEDGNTEDNEEDDEEDEDSEE